MQEAIEGILNLKSDASYKGNKVSKAASFRLFPVYNAGGHGK